MFQQRTAALIHILSVDMARTTLQSVRMMIDIYVFIFIDKVRENIRKLAARHCLGCRNDHVCLPMSELEQFERYFHAALDGVCCDDVLVLWKRSTTRAGLPQDLREIFVALLQSFEVWLPDVDKLYETTKKTIQLESRFTDQ